MSDDEEKLEEKYEYIKPNATIYIINEIQEDSGIEAAIDERKDQPYIPGTVLKVNKTAREVDVYIVELQKNITVKFELTLPISNMQLLKKIENLTDYYPNLNYMDILNVFKIRFKKRKYFTKIGQDLLVYLEPYQNKYNLFTYNEKIFGDNYSLSDINKDGYNNKNNKFINLKHSINNNKSSINDYMNDSMNSELDNKNVSESQNSNQSTKEDIYFDEFFENNQNEIYIFKGEMFSNKYILFEKLLCKLLPEHNILSIKIEDDEFINIENNNHIQDNTLLNPTSILNNNSYTGKIPFPQSNGSINIDTKIFICYKILKFFGCLIENIEQNNNNVQQNSFDDDNYINISNKKEECTKINYKYLMRINIQYDKHKKILGAEFLPILFCENDLSYILTHVIFYSILCITINEKLYHELYILNMPHIKEHIDKSKKFSFVLSQKLKEVIMKEFNINILIKYLSLLNFTEEEIKTILNICAAIIYLNEINFKTNMIKGNTIIENEENIRIISDLLKIKEDNIKSFLYMTMDDINGETNSKVHKYVDYENNKSLFAKVLYTSLFDWLVNKINTITKYDNKINLKSKINDIPRVSKNSIELPHKYKDENEIKNDEEKNNDEDSSEIKSNKKTISTKIPKNLKDSINNTINVNNLNSSVNEDKSRDDFFKDVYDIKNKKIIVEDIPHTTSCLISPGFRYQYDEKLGLYSFLSNYINEKLFYSFYSIIYKRKLNELKEEGLEEEANNIPFSNTNNIIELYEHESFNLLDIINDFCNDHLPSQLSNDIIPLFTDLNTKFALNEQIKFGTRDSKDFLIYQTEEQAKYDLTRLIKENYNDIPFEIYKTLLSSTNNVVNLIVLGILREEEILNKKDNLIDEFVMSNGYPRKRTFVINIFKNSLSKIFENIDGYEVEDLNKNEVNKYKFFLCFKSNNDLIPNIIYSRYLFNQLVYCDLLDVVNFYKEQFEHEITYEKFVYKIFRKVDPGSNNKSIIKQNEESNSVNNIPRINDIQQKTLRIINTLIDFKVPKWFQSYEPLDLTAKNYVLGNTKIFLQSNFYNFLLYKMQALIENKRRSILKILAHFKGFFFRRKYQKFIRSIIGVQQYFWKYKEQLKKEMYMKKIITLQTYFRAFKTRKKYKNEKHAQILISKNYRMHLQMKKFKKIKRSVHILVPVIKSYISFLIIKEHKDLKDLVYNIINAAFDKIILKQKIVNSIKINAVCRRYLFHLNHPKLIAQIKKTINLKKLIKSASVIQQYYRTYKTFKEFHYKKFAVDIIRGYWKMKRSVKYIDDLYNSIIPIQRRIKKYLQQKRIFIGLMKNFLEQKYKNYLVTENKKILHYFHYIQREHLQKEGYLQKSNNGYKKIMNILKESKISNKSFRQKIRFFTEINDIDVYNTSIIVYNNEFWCDKFYKLLKIDKKLFGDNSSFLDIKLGETYSCLLNSKGKIYTFGWNEHGQCNIDTVSSENKNITSLSFSQIECCNKYSFLMNNKGEISKGFDKYSGIQFNGYTSNYNDAIYAWKDNYYYKFQEKNISKFKLNLNPKKNSIIKKIACGKNFVIILSDMGMVYSYGSNSKGQLGLQDYKERKSPCLNELLVKDGERINDISCGYKHVIALGYNGKVFSWGNNSNGQCGIDIDGNFNTPMYIDVKNKIKFIAICCGFRASFFMDERRLIYFCGKSGTYNGENYYLKPFKNIIGEKETFELINVMNNANNNLSKMPVESFKSKKTIRSSSTLNIKKNFESNIIPCLNKNIFPVKLNSTWNESFSIMYITYADITNLIKNAYKKELNKIKIRQILDKITNVWITDNTNLRSIMRNYKDIIEYL